MQEGYPLDAGRHRADTLLSPPDQPLCATSLLVRFNPDRGVLQIAVAGHPPALLVAGDGSIRFLEAAGRPLGYPEAGSTGTTVVDLETAAITAASMALPQLLDTVLAGCLRSDPLRDDTLLLGLRWHRAGDRPASRDDLGVRLPDSPDAPAMVRQYLLQRAAGLASAVLEDALVLVSELVGNAVRHGAAPIGLRLGVDGGSVRVDVTDGGGPFEHDAVAVPSTGPTSGRGLFLVEAMAVRWGVDPTAGGGGKTVWFEL